MIYYLALFLLAPVLLIQGRYVRRVTPLLPEPEGERSGVAGNGPELGLLIVGDSAAAGVGVGHQCQALSGQLVSRLGEQFSLRWRVFAQSGDTSHRLIRKLQSLPPEKYHAAVVSIGVNDVTARTRSSVWRRNIREIVRLLKQKCGAERVYLSSIPPMHKFPALPNPLRWWLGLRARQLDALMASVANEEPGCVYVAIPYATDCSEIAADGFHPGARAYKVWGEHVAGLVQASVGGQDG